MKLIKIIKEFITDLKFKKDMKLLLKEPKYTYKIIYK